VWVFEAVEHAKAGVLGARVGLMAQRGVGVVVQNEAEMA
jgi:hypothetical protein